MKGYAFLPRITSTTLIAVAVAACGGGGSDGPALAPLVSLTAGNGEAVASETLAALQELTSGSLGEDLVALESRAREDTASLALKPLRSAPFGKRRAGGGPAAVVTEIIPCDQGTMTLTVNDADGNNDLSVGDVIRSDFKNCRDDASGHVITGVLQLRVDRVTGNPIDELPPYGLGVSATLGDLSTTSLFTGRTDAVNGQIRLDLDVRADNTSTIRQRGSLLEMSRSGGSTTGTVERILRDFDLLVEEHLGSGDFQFDGFGSLQSSAIGGRVSFETLLPFRGFGGDNPSVGRMEIRGAGAGAITLEPVDSLVLTLVLDTNGDGLPEFGPTAMAWPSDSD